VGLVAREIETAGIPTVVLSNIPVLTGAVGVPRMAAIEYPIGLTLGVPEDREGQLAVLRATLALFEIVATPGGAVDLPFDWEYGRNEPETEPPVPPPIVNWLIRRPWQLPRLLARDVPEAG
jgi:D-proline reductase (dithiol) PrdB